MLFRIAACLLMVSIVGLIVACIGAEEDSSDDSFLFFWIIGIVVSEILMAVFKPF